MNGEPNYLGIEIQPSVFECLANTVAQFENYRSFPMPIADAESVGLSSFRYTESVSVVTETCMDIPAVTWRRFLDRFKIDQIDLLKINIEGVETAFLRSAQDLSCVQRVVFGAHDFRADRGDGEYFRTVEDCLEILSARGFRMEQVCPHGPDSARCWYYGER